MFKRTIFVLFCVLTVSSTLCAQDDPVMGTWKLNLAKSKFIPGPTPKSVTMKREPSGANGIHYVTDTVTAQGATEHVEYTATYDGKEYPVKGDPNRDSISIKKIDAHHYEFTNKKAGKVTASGGGVVSPDGKTLTITAKGINAQGQETNNVQVYDKQ
jgi:hypothetical protein